MRSVVWATFLVVATIGGCAEQTETLDTVEEVATSDQNQTLQPFFVSMAAADNATAGSNITLELGVEGPEALNASLVAWDLQSDNGTGNTSMANGTGLPALLNVTLDAGNITLLLTATADGFLPANATLDLAVLEGLPDDPCAAAAVQEPITISALFAAVAVDGAGLYQGHGFALEPCQTMVFAEITSSEAYLDPMLRLKDNTGATVDQEDNEFLYHDTLTYEPGGYLEPGTWQIDARGYIGAPGYYTIVLSFE